MASSQTDIYNLALILLGSQTIMSPTDGSKNSRILNAVYDIERQSELRKAPAWNFAIKMVKLPASSVTPVFDRQYSYPLPSDFLAEVPPYPESNYQDRDWVIQSGQIYTNYQPPLNFRYVSNVVDTGLFDPCFVKALAAKLAETVCEAITQSTGKLQTANVRYKQARDEAAKANSFDNVPEKMPRDYWLDVRL